MAYMNQDQKKIISEALKVALKSFPSVKVSLSIQHHSTITCTIKQGPACLAPKDRGYEVINHYHIDRFNTKESAEILNVIKDCLHIGHYDNTDTQSDYFDCAWYIGIKIGTYEKAYVTV
jgi:hypothetical protein